MDYEISLHEVPDHEVVSIRERLEQSELPSFFGRAFSELYQRLELLGVAPAGEPFAIYHDFGPGGVDVEVCAPVASEVEATGRITARTVPGGTLATTLHVGPYEQLGAAYRALETWIADHGYEVAAPVRERYLTGPEVPPLERRTVIEMPVALRKEAVSGEARRA